MGRVYATAADYQEWTGETPPADIDRRLARASEQVELATLAAFYDVDAAGMPTDPEVATAMQGATCLQALWWKTTGDEQGDAGLWTAVRAGSVALSGRQSGAGSASGRLAPQARTVLQVAGLVGGPIGT